MALAAVTVLMHWRSIDEDSASTESDATYRTCRLADGLSATPPAPLAALPPCTLLEWRLPTSVDVFYDTPVPGALLARAPPRLVHPVA